MTLRPVLYLDLDHTVISWRGGTPRAAPGARDFLRWALRHYEVRWLTTWCPGGEMEDRLLHDLARMLGMSPHRLREIRGFDWDGTGSKVNGVAWLEHRVLGRPFLWLEDEYGFGPFERRFLEEHGHLGAYRHLNVTRDPDALRTLHRSLRAEHRKARAISAGAGTSLRALDSEVGRTILDSRARG